MDTQSKPRKQKRLGPAPIASFEDSSDELRLKMEPSTSSKAESQLECVVEQETPKKKNPSVETMSSKESESTPKTASTGINLAVRGLRVSGTPRIDISRASSSSQHEDSRDSSPDNVFEQVGTGTLQETEVATGLGFSEDGANDLRSSTEELYFIEGNKKKNESVKEIEQSRPSPVLFKFDEQHQACLTQNQRKDSASSEVAALLCISGRTSRISSVGSQGSAVSRLSVISGVSRSPSPHKMLLETSFCGPKPADSEGKIGGSVEPITAEELEQVILARKHDLTKVIVAEGIQIDTSTPKTPRKASNANASTSGINTTAAAKQSKPLISSGRIGLGRKGPGAMNKVEKQKIVGVTPQGTEYYRIKLKPDHLYEDRGIGPNEKVIEEAEGVKKPGSLSLGRESTKKAAPHFSQLVKAEESSAKDQKSTPHLSPKPSRQAALRSNGSRSPSPATVNVSRKSSFCSLFKSKETVISPDSPTTGGQRKKSAISILLDSPRDRSRSKSRESDRSGQSANSTPSKQKSVLAIFKPKRSGLKSKSASPVEPEIMLTIERMPQSNSNRKLKDEQESQQKSKQSLKYYDPPPPGSDGVIIPLHTPPDEMDSKTSTSKPSTSYQIEITVPKTDVALSVSTEKDNVTQVEKEITVVNETKTPLKSSAIITSHKITPKKTPEKVYRIENADGSIRIPLRSPSEEHTDNDADTSNWSTVVQRNSSQESQDTVISSKAPSLVNAEGNNNKNEKFTKKEVIETVDVSKETKKSPIPLRKGEKIIEATVETAVETTTVSRTMTREKKRILFSTKIGSGSDEQVFATQLSLSKTASLSSQLSEQISIAESPPGDKDETTKSKPDQIEQDVETVKLRNKEKSSANYNNETKCDEKSVKQGFINTNRHSMYIENIDEIMETQRKIDNERKRMEESVEKQNQNQSGSESPTLICIVKEVKAKNKEEIPKASLDRAAVSSESEHELESDVKNNKKHQVPMPRQIGAVEEESTGLVSQDSLEDELPYVPTTLPEERSLGVVIIPVRDRALMDVKMCPVERPRSTTPLNPSFLEEYCGATDECDYSSNRCEKLRINLPRKEVRDSSCSRTKSPRRTSNASGKSWFEFAEQGIGVITTTASSTICSPSTHTSDAGERRNSIENAPPLPPRKAQNTSEWINFDNIPEKRKPPKRITTLPHKNTSSDNANAHHIQYNFVNPEDCQCECHEMEREGTSNADSDKKEVEAQTPDDTIPLLESDPDDVGTANRYGQPDLDLTYDIDESTGSRTFAERECDSEKIRQAFGMNTRDESGQKRSCFSSEESQSPPATRSTTTTNVQIPQRSRH